MSSASDTTLRRKQRTLFADRIVQQEVFDRGLKNHIVLEGGNSGIGAMTYPPYYNMIGGALETTQAEVNAYKASVPNVTTVPGAPMNIIATAGNGQATVGFAAPANNGGSPILSYTVTSSPGGFFIIGSSSILTVTGLTNGTAYTFTVVATNALGTSEPSAASNSVTPATVPGAPTGVSAVAGDAEATVSFTAPVSDGGSIITSYTVTSTPGSFTATGTSSPLTVTGLTNGTGYTFRVVATNAIGNSVASSASSSVTPFTPAEPGIPTLTYALPTDGGVYVYVTPTGGAEAAPTNYEYNTGGSNTALSPPDVASPVLVPSLTNGTSYSIQLAATNSVGTSALSNTLTSTPNTTAVPTSWLTFDPDNTSSYSGSGTTVNNVGSYGALSGTMTGSISAITGTGTTRKVFNMAGGYVNFLNSNFDFGTDITITAWIRPQDKFSINCIFANGVANANTPGFKFAWNWWNSTSRALFLENGSGVAGEWGTAGSVADTIAMGEWQHVACVFKRDQQAALMLRNGLPVNASNTNTAPNVDMNNPTFTIGSFVGGSYTMLGQLGLVRVYNSALTAYQVYQDFLLEKTAFGL